ncbi:MAG TPA: cysteine rich repeat-containing protein [Casimicrobiaceae bacterium]|nr:cysteine rich repeat-containing protein [Casimicrobiaceae bacterium]
MRNSVLVLLSLALSTPVALAADQSPSSSPRMACKADVEKLCSGVQPGGGRIAACLKQNEAQVSAACKDAIAGARQKKSPQGASSPPG